MRGDRPPSPSVAIVAFDNDTLRRLRVRPPPPRDVQADVVDHLDRAGARVVAFDFSLEQPSADEQQDRMLALALMNARKAVVAVVAPDTAGGVADLAGFIPFTSTEVRPGYTALGLDSQGVVRGFTRAPGNLQSFSVAAAQALTSARRIKVPSGALIDYPGPTGTFRTISYIDVLRGNFDHHAVRGRIVVVGPTATIFGDGHRVPVDSTMPGPEIHAAAIATALAGFPLRSASALVARRIAFGAGFLVPLMLLGIAAVSRPIRGARGGGGIPLDAPGPIVVTATGAVACAAWLVLAQVEFDRGTVVELLPALIAVAVSTGATGVVASAVTRRARRRLRTRFAARDKFVVRQVLASTGRRRAVTARDVIGGYLIEEPIGSGGMGEVYRAVQIRLERRVALKLILADHALDRRYRRQFVAEAHRTAAITHPNVIAVIDAGEADGVLFIAMPFIEGSDLAQSLRNVHQLEVTYVVRVIHRVGCALDAAHAIGLVHGDVKPENILIPDRSPEHPLLVDFGVARTADEIGTRAKSGGTIAYMAPERLSGLTSGRPADVYALAAVLLGCLIGERAAREARASFADHRRSMPDARRGLPSAIGAVIATAMAADPGVRHPTATAFTRAAAAALGVTVTDDEPVPQPPARPAPSAQAEIDPTEID